MIFTKNLLANHQYQVVMTCRFIGAISAKNCLTVSAFSLGSLVYWYFLKLLYPDATLFITFRFIYM